MSNHCFCNYLPLPRPQGGESYVNDIDLPSVILRFRNYFSENIYITVHLKSRDIINKILLSYQVNYFFPGIKTEKICLFWQDAEEFQVYIITRSGQTKQQGKDFPCRFVIERRDFYSDYTFAKVSRIHP
ncbi:MAG: hypothetical protein V2I97_01295 [Desulfococcaceae bacterium]|jgi:hypothetical protein|nr:hypothetical protein [Desulfococcaceae bacterium]